MTVLSVSAAKTGITSVEEAVFCVTALVQSAPMELVFALLGLICSTSNAFLAELDALPALTGTPVLVACHPFC